MLLAYSLVFLLRHLICFSMDLLNDSFYNVLVTRYDEVSKPFESRWFVSVDSFSVWLKTIDLQHSEVTIRDIEEINFDAAVSPRWFRFGD